MRKALLLLLYLFLGAETAYTQSVGGTTSGAATYCGFTNSGFVSVVGQSGTIVGWESSTDGGITWTPTGSSTPSQSYFNLTQSTCYHVIVQNGAFPPDTSTVVCITIFAPTVPGTVSGGGTFCSTSGSGTLTLSGNTGNVLNWMSSTDGGLTWTTISNTTTTLSYSGITQNTLYSAVVQNSPACLIDTSSTASFVIDAPTVAGTVSPDTSVCPGINSGTLTLAGNTGAVVNWIYSTNGGASWTTILNTGNTQVYGSLVQSTVYGAVVQNASCPADTAIATVTVFPLPAVNAGTDTIIAPGQSVLLNGSGLGTPFWLNGSTLNNATIFNPIATPAATTAYILTVTDANTCINADTVVVTVSLPVFNGVVSSYFSPNGDNINDTWYIENIKAFTDSEVTVFNIYGQEVYTKKNYQNDWKGTYNGSDLPDGTYYYVLKFASSSKVVKGSVDIFHKK